MNLSQVMPILEAFSEASLEHEEEEDEDDDEDDSDEAKEDEAEEKAPAAAASDEAAGAELGQRKKFLEPNSINFSFGSKPKICSTNLSLIRRK